MQRLLWLFLLLLPSTGALFADNAIEAKLRKEYVNSDLFFRAFYAADNLKFDEAGQIAGHPVLGSWTVVGSVTIDALKLKAKTLELRGHRNIIVFDEKQHEMKHANLKITWAAQIQTHPGPDQQKQLESAMKAIFVVPGEDLASVLPDYWQDYVERFTGKKNSGEPCEESQPSVGGKAPVNVSKGVTDGLKIKDAIPLYSSLARQAGITGELQLRAMINKSGDVEKTCILHGLGAGLDDEAVHVVRQWKYQPYLLNGEPVEIGTTITMRFGMR